MCAQLLLQQHKQQVQSKDRVSKIKSAHVGHNVCQGQKKNAYSPDTFESNLFVQLLQKKKGNT